MVLNTGHIVGVLTEEPHCEMDLLFACLNHMPLGSFLETLLVQRYLRNEFLGAIRGTLVVWSLLELDSSVVSEVVCPRAILALAPVPPFPPSVRWHGQGCPLGGL